MKNPLDTWYYRGREARGLGRPRELGDGRVSAENRASWGRGWDDEDTLRAPKPTEAQAAQFNAFCQDLAAEVRATIPPITISSVEDEMITLRRGEHYITNLHASDPAQARAFHQAHAATSRDSIQAWRALLDEFQRTWTTTDHEA